MSLVVLLVLLVLLGLAMWLVNAHIPMATAIKQIVNVVAVLVAFLLVLYAFGLLDGSGIRIK